MTQTEDPRLKARVEGRKEANELIELADALACALCNNFSLDASDVFWQEVRKFALTMSPLPPVEPKVIKARPMTDEQAREFEKEQIPFGFLLGHRVGEAMSLRSIGTMGTSGPEYLGWLADQTFVDDLRRYLANETITRQQ